MGTNNLRIVCISDTHGKHKEVQVPDGDCLIHAGDCTDDIGQASLRNFLRWFQSQPHRFKLLVAGNHDGAYEKWPDLAKAMMREIAPDVTYLQDSSVIIEGLKFWGSPVSPSFCNWYFNRGRGPEIRRHWDMIPDNTDVLITHGPPYGMLDISGFDNEHCGCRDLRDAMYRVMPELHVFGHVHHDGGKTMNYWSDCGHKTILVNASVVNERYKVANKPVIVDLCV